MESLNQLDLNDARTFVVVARAGTFSAAAKELSLPPSTIARSMTRLEQHLDVLLMRRSPRGISLTDAGEQFLRSCRRALRTLKIGSESLQERRANPHGLIRVASPSPTARNILLPILPEFLRRFPELRIELETYANDWDQEPRENVDVFFKILKSRDSTRRVRIFPTTLRGLFASNAYLKRFGSPTAPEQLFSHSCIGMNVWKLTKEQETIEVAPRFRVAVCDPFIVQQFVLEDFGIGPIPLVMALQPEVRSRLTPILPEWMPQPFMHCALYFGPSRLAPKVHVFLDFVGEFFGTGRDPRLGLLRAEDVFGRPIPRALEAIKPNLFTPDSADHDVQIASSERHALRTQQ